MQSTNRTLQKLTLYAKCFTKLEKERQVSSMIHLARPTVLPVANIVFA